MSTSALDPGCLLDAMAAEGLIDWLGVPDSTLEPVLARLGRDGRFHDLIAANECEAVSVAMGQYLASSRPSVVYLQNSGFGKTIHPITSLLSPEICSVPVLLLIGWRGAPDGPLDEPQHVTMGRVMQALLETIGVPFEVLEPDAEAIARAVRSAHNSMRERSAPYALIVRPGLFAVNGPKPQAPDPDQLTRLQVLEELVAHLPPETVFVSTTGKTSRELFFIREDRGQDHAHDLYTVGGMGCASSIGLGVATQLQRAGDPRTVCVVDGDGAALMQLGTMATIGHLRPPGLLHVVIDNGCYESTGALPTISESVDFAAIARSVGYPVARRVGDRAALKQALVELRATQELRLLVVGVAPGSDPKLGRPNRTPRDNAESFRSNLAIREE